MTIKELLDVVDYNREGYGAILIEEDGNDRYQTLYTSSVMLEAIEDKKIASLGVKDGMLCVWLDTREVEE